MKIGGLDIGTTGCKITVFDERGDIAGKAYRDYPVRRASFGHEIDVSAMTESVFDVLSEMSARFPDIASIGVTSFGETFVLTDENGLPLCDSMLYTDPRGKDELRELTSKISETEITAITGLSPHEMYSISKIMWVKKHRPDLYAGAKHIFLIEDYIIFRLTGTANITYSLATRTMAFDLKNLCWSEKIFDAAGVDIAKMSKPVQAGTVAGKWKGISIVSVAHDQVAACAGAGVFDEKTACEGAGTVECLTPVYNSLPDVSVMASGNYCIVPHVIPGKYCAYAFSYTGGALIKWCVDTFGKDGTYDSLEKPCSKDEPTGLLVLPHFAGAATPYMDTGSKGAIIGLTTATSPSDIYRACMEGVCYEMMLNYETLKPSGISFDRINASGGGARSSLWMQMKADVLNIPITALLTIDAGTAGCAMVAAVSAGLFKDIGDAADVMVRKGTTYYPRRDIHEKYMTVYERYRKLYNAVRPLV